MSLIQDALRRKSEDRPGVPPTTIQAEPPNPPMDEKKKKTKLVVPLILLLIAFLAVPLGYSIYLTKPKQRVSPPAVIQKSVPVTHVAATPTPVAPIAVPQPVTLPEPPIQAVETTKVETVVEPVKKEEPVPAKPIEWPELNLTGIAQSDNQSLAFINGKMLSAGRMLGKVTIREVTPTNVLVEYQGESRILYIGE